MPIGFHPIELIAILVIALLVFGPKKLPEMGSAIGKSIKEFQKGMREITGGAKDDDEDFRASAKASLEAIEREIAAKKAAANAAEATQPEVSTEAKETKETETKEARVD